MVDSPGIGDGFCSPKIIPENILVALLGLYRAYNRRARLVSGVFDNPSIGKAFFPDQATWTRSYDEPSLWVGVLADIATENVLPYVVKQRAERLATLPFVDQVFFFRGKEHLLEIASCGRDIFSIPRGNISDYSHMLIGSYGGKEFDPESLVALTELG